MVIKEVSAKTILSKSGIPGFDFCLNPYTGCTHACLYCYAVFMKKFTGHTEEWGRFVDVKVNANKVLKRQVKKKGPVIISSVTDPYQPIEAKYKITRECLTTLLEYQFPVNILTKSPLLLRDMELFKNFNDIKVGVTITTDNDRIRKMFEPNAPPIEARLKALKTLKENGINTFVFIGPLLPMNPDGLSKEIAPYADKIFIDGMNYRFKTERIYRKNNLIQWLDVRFTDNVIEKLRRGFLNNKVEHC